jgi:hypothetical protein
VRTAAAATLLCLVLAAAGCAADDPEAGPSGRPTRATPSPSAEVTPTETTPSASASTSAADPSAPTTGLLAWEPTGRPVEETLTTGGGWTVVVDRERSLATVDGPQSFVIAGDKRFRISEVLLDTGWLAVVRSDSLEERPDVATVIDLTTGNRSDVTGRSEVPTTTGGTWALQGGVLVHATIGPDRAYCLARRDLAAGSAETAWCAAPRHGFTHARITPDGLAVMTFDDQRPSCRTLGTVTDGMLTGWPGPTDCKGWELVPTASGLVWSEVPREHTLDEAEVHVRSGDTDLDLGPATSDSLTWCAGATYFVRDPQAAGEPARLLRWTDAGALEVVYESKGGQAFLSAPRCGGDRITLSAFAESGDEQVSAPLG